MQITINAKVYGKTEYANRPGETHVTLDCGNNNMFGIYLRDDDAAQLKRGADLTVTITEKKG